jgi:L-alanine-DL-glutamate epimerase-like enolase superfamily enzyme
VTTASRVIADVKPILVDIPMRDAVHGVHGTQSVQRSVLVRVATGDGREGWGNVDPTPGYSLVSAADVHEAIRRLAPSLIGHDLTLVEQPLPRADVRGLAALRSAIRIPLMADESVTGPASLLEIIRLGAADIVKVKVMKQGGLTRTKQMVDLRPDGSHADRRARADGAVPSDEPRAPWSGRRANHGKGGAS